LSAGAAPDARTAGQFSLEERKVVTILFADVTGSTPLGERLDPERTRTIMARFFEAMTAVIARHGGTVEKFIGDEVMAVFGLPAAHEDDPERAVRAALTMHDELAHLNDTLPAHDAPGLQIRVGINTGEVVANPRAVEKGDFLVTGDAVNVAARLRAAAEPGETIVGERTYRRTEPVIEYEPCGPLRVRGKAEPVNAWRARSVRPEPIRARGLHAPLVGRESELDLLTGFLQRVVRERKPHLVTVLGQPGVGKSRLFEEFSARHPQVAVRIGRSLPYGSTSMWAVAEILRADCGILRSDSPEESAGKLQRRLAALFQPDGRSGEREAVHAQLLRVLARGAEPNIGTEEARDELFWALRRYVEALAASAPLLLTFEDTHSADSELLDLVEALAATAAAPVLLVCLARPDLLEHRPGWGGGRRNFTSLFLEPLADADTEALIAGLLGGQVPPPVAGAVSAAGGNPLFIEEMVRMLIDRGSLARTNGEWHVAGTLSGLPDSVQGAIAARLDELAPQDKALILDAAVLGKDFWSGALQALTGSSPTDLGSLLDRLEARDFILERETSRLAGQQEFTFKHMLIRDVAYGVLPKSARAEKHAAFARWLQATLGTRVEEFAELLAHHWLQAVRLADEVGTAPEETRRSALHYTLLAGRKAALVYANEQALTQFQTAQSLAETIGAERERIAAIEGQAGVFALQARWEEASRRYQEALAYHQGRGDAVGQAKVESRMASTFSGIFDFRQALPHIQSAVRHLQGSPEQAELAGAYVQMARAQIYLGQFTEAEQNARAGHEVAERLDLRVVAAEALGMIAWAKTLLGDPAPSAYDLGTYLEVAEESGDARRVISARMGRGYRALLRGDYADSVADLDAALERAEQAGDRPRIALCLYSIANIRRIEGRWTEATELLERYLAEFSDITSWLEYVRTALAFLKGEIPEALTWAERAVKRGELRGDIATHGQAIDWHATLCLWMDRPADALEAARGGIAHFESMRVFWPAYLHPLAAEAAVKLGALDDAQGHLRAGASYAWMQLHPAEARLDRARGALAAAEGRWSDAAALLQTTADRFASLTQPYDQAYTLRTLARVLRTGGASDAARADAVEGEATAIFARLGARPS
jgi:class 3 adenylate cyclase/tetratricopeptide (TPR) repeat protein